MEHLGSTENIVIGSSMGGWISLWLASQEKYKKMIKSLMVIAPAVNFLRPFYAELLKKLPKEARDTLDRGEVKKRRIPTMKSRLTFSLDLPDPG